MRGSATMAGSHGDTVVNWTTSNAGNVGTIETGFSSKGGVQLVQGRQGGLTFHTYLKLVPGSPALVVFLPSARGADRTKWQNPQFSRWKWSQHLPVSSLVLDDPTIGNTDLVGGWFQGTREVWAVDAAAEIIAAVARQQSIPAQRILLYGSSLGGFGSLMLASRLRGAYAMAEVPQTDLQTYPFIRHIRSMTEHVYGSADVASIAQQFPTRFSVLEQWRAEQFVPRCHIIHEASDEPHGSSQFAPFAAQMTGVDAVKLEVLSRGCGHAVLPLELALPRINAALDALM